VEKSVIGQMQDAYQECLAKGLSAIMVSRKLRRDYLGELNRINSPQLKKKGWLLPTYNGYPLIPEDSLWWAQRQKMLKDKL